MAVGAPIQRSGAARIDLRRIGGLARSRTGRLGLAVVVGVLVAAFAYVAAGRVADTPWPLARGNAWLLLAAGGFSLLGYAFKAYGWQRLFARAERPRPLALVAALGAASITALALPGRFDDVVRIAVVRRFRDCPAGVRALCLSLLMLGLVDAVALAPLAFVAALLPGQPLTLRVGLGLLAGVGLVAAAVVIILPGAAAGRLLRRFRLGRWLRPRTVPLQDALAAWAFVSACWLARVGGLVVLLGALGVGFSFTLALLFLCASSAAAALPVGPGGTATQAGAGAAVLIASGVGASQAVSIAVASQVVGMLVGGGIFLCATAWRSGLRLAPRLRTTPAAAIGEL